MARILSDQADLAGAFDAWSSALQLDPMRTSALKGIAFLYFRAGDSAAALDHLQRAMEVDPDDPTIRQAFGRMAAARSAPSPAEEAAPGESSRATDVPSRAPAVRAEPGSSGGRTPGLFDGIDGGEPGLLLIDGNGLRLGGELASSDGENASDRVAAQLAGVSREAARATRLLGLGSWHAIAIECP